MYKFKIRTQNFVIFIGVLIVWFSLFFLVNIIIEYAYTFNQNLGTIFMVGLSLT